MRLALRACCASFGLVVVWFPLCGSWCSWSPMRVCAHGRRSCGGASSGRRTSCSARVAPTGKGSGRCHRGSHVARHVPPRQLAGQRAQGQLQLTPSPFECNVAISQVDRLKPRRLKRAKQLRQGKKTQRPNSAILGLLVLLVLLHVVIVVTCTGGGLQNYISFQNRTCHRSLQQTQLRGAQKGWRRPVSFRDRPECLCHAQPMHCAW